MANEFKDVIRLEAPTDADITGGTPVAVKLKQQVHSLSSGRFWYKNSSGTLVEFLPAALFSSQSGGGLGSGLIGDSGISGVTPLGGTVGGPANAHAMMVGLKNYADTRISSVSLLNLFPLWDEETSFSQNDIVVWTGDGGYYLAISNVPGTGTNTGNNPQDANIEFWTSYTAGYPLAEVLTMILNTKANNS